MNKKNVLIGVGIVAIYTLYYNHYKKSIYSGYIYQ